MTTPSVSTGSIVLPLAWESLRSLAASFPRIPHRHRRGPQEVVAYLTVGAVDGSWRGSHRCWRGHFLPFSLELSTKVQLLSSLTKPVGTNGVFSGSPSAPPFQTYSPLFHFLLARSSLSPPRRCQWDTITAITLGPLESQLAPRISLYAYMPDV